MLATASVRLFLKGTVIANNSYVDVDDIGEGNETSLLCHTNKANCCGLPSRKGEWYFPGGNPVGNTGKFPDRDFYRDRGPQVVRLHHRQGAQIQRGRFRCEIPDDKDVMQSIYAYIGMLIP